MAFNWLDYSKDNKNTAESIPDRKMLSSWANYLLGYGAPAPVEEQENLRVTEGEEDWLVVTTEQETSGRSRSSSLDSGTEASWFVTPPPVFTSTGPVTLVTSPLENLLIEHPSMSVYRRVRRSPSPAERAGSQPGRAPSPQRQAASPAATPAPHRPPLRAANTPAVLLFTTQSTLLKGAQKAKVIQESQMAKPKFLDRTNRVRESNKRNKKPRRAERQRNPSGANNNRKCC